MRGKCFRRFLMLLTLSISVVRVSAICDGGTIGIGSLQTLSNGTQRWSFFDNSCNSVYFVDLTATKNPCLDGVFACTPVPNVLYSYVNQTDGSKFTCAPEQNPTPDFCDSIPIQNCCAKGLSTPTMSTTSPTSFISIPASSTLPNSTSPSFSSSSSSSFSSPPAGVSGQTSKHSNVAAIAGGTVGAIAVLLLLTLVILFCTRRRRAIRVNGRGEDGLGAYDAPRGMNDLTPYRISIPASPHSGKYTMGWTDVVQNGGGGGQLKAPRMIGEGVADISESASPVGGEEWRTELDNIRREVQEMRTSTRFELPPVYHADAER